MADFLAQLWKRQPQGPVRVNWGNPLTRGLIYLDNPALGWRPVHSVVGGTLQIVGSGWGTFAPPPGVSVKTAAGNRGSIALDATAFANAVSGQKATVATYYTSDILGGSGDGFHQLGQTSSQEHYVFGGQAYLGSFRSIRSGAIAPNTTVLSRPHVLTITADAAANAWLAYQGNTVFSSSTFTWQTAAAPRLYGWNQLGANVYDGLNRGCGGVALWNRVLTAAEVRELNAAWWTLFLPLRPRIYSLPSAGVSFKPAWARNANVILQPGAL